MTRQLDAFDREMLMEGGVALCDRFIQDCALKGKMPDVVILPDTTARPFAALLKPIFKEIAKRTGWKVPHIVFFRIDQGANTGSVLNVAVRNRVTIEQIMRGEVPAAGSIKRLAHEGLAEDTDRWKKRAQSIRDALAKSGVDHPDIVIIDDYMSPMCTTANAVRYAFSDPNIPVYAWMSSRYVHDNMRDSLHVVGVVDKNYPNGRGHFHFKGQPGVGVVKHPAKRGMYAEPDSSSEVEKGALRSEMRKIGEAIRDTLSIDAIVRDAKPSQSRMTDAESGYDDWMM